MRCNAPEKRKKKRTTRRREPGRGAHHHGRPTRVIGGTLRMMPLSWEGWDPSHVVPVVPCAPVIPSQPKCVQGTRQSGCFGTKRSQSAQWSPVALETCIRIPAGAHPIVQGRTWANRNIEHKSIPSRPLSSSLFFFLFILSLITASRLLSFLQ